jgi:class III cytochrome C family protein
MRKLLVGGIAAAAISVATGIMIARPTTAQQAAKKVEADSVVAPRLTVGDSALLKGPRQPIFFRHDIHAGQYKIQCQYCHYSVNYASEPGIPSLQSCMGCHLAIGGTDSTHRAEIKKLREAWTQKQPVEWVRIHQIAKHAHFPHMRHVKAMGPAACGTCHGDVARMPQVFKVNNVNNMGFCISCHLERNVIRDCAVCHY